MPPRTGSLPPPLFAGLLTVLAFGGGCDSCSCSRLRKEWVGTAPEAEVEKEVVRQLPTASQVAEEMCGFPAKGLELVEQTVESSNLGTAMVKIKARPILEPPAKGAKPDPELDKKEALVCVGVVALGFKVVLDDEDEMESIDFRVMTTSKVETPGVAFTPPSSDWDD